MNPRKGKQQRPRKAPKSQMERGEDSWGNTKKKETALAGEKRCVWGRGKTVSLKSLKKKLVSQIVTKNENLRT